MYCKNCGTQIDDNTNFCPNCGIGLNGLNDAQQNTSVETYLKSQPDVKMVSDKWIWALATIPIITSWILPIIFAVIGIKDADFSLLVILGLNTLFVLLDMRQLRYAGWFIVES